MSLTAGAENRLALPCRHHAESNLPPMNTILLRVLLACLCAGYMTAARSERRLPPDYFLGVEAQDPNGISLKLIFLPIAS